jgi:hypothetical protein
MAASVILSHVYSNMLYFAESTATTSNKVEANITAKVASVSLTHHYLCTIESATSTRVVIARNVSGRTLLEAGFGPGAEARCLSASCGKRGFVK